MAAGGVAHATADGPDHYRVRGVSPGRHLTLRAEPSTASVPLARIPSDATCLRSLGCRGGLSFEEFTTLGEEDQRRRAAENPRWCKVDYRGTVGWVAGAYLAEDGVFAFRNARDRSADPLAWPRPWLRESQSDSYLPARLLRSPSRRA